MNKIIEDYRVLNSAQLTILRSEIDEKIDIYTQTVFKELIQEKIEQHLKFVLTVVDDESGKKSYFSGEDFFRHYMTGNQLNPTNRLSYSAAHFYELNGDTFEYFTKLDSTSQEEKINAIYSLVKVNKETSDEERNTAELFLATEYEQAKKLEKARISYEKVANSNGRMSDIIQATYRLVILTKKQDWLNRFKALPLTDKDHLFLLAYHLKGEESQKFYKKAAEKGHPLAILKLKSSQ